MNSPKIALVKQEVYQDLYVCPVTEKDPAQVLFSSQGRVGPIGLMAELDADFYIVKETYEPETQLYRKVIPHIAKYLYLLKTETLDKIPGQEFKQPGSTHANGEYAVEASNIDWGQYDIVISINISLPTNLILQYPHTLFAYMIGEANMATRKVRFGYDATLNQMARGITTDQNGVIDFPYTFVKGDTLEHIMQKAVGRTSRKQGVFMEINSTKERPVTRVPHHFHPLEEIGQHIILHQQRIAENLRNIYDAKYFVKMGGRQIRGNSVAEAVSLGALAIMNRNEVIHKELIIDECHVENMDEVIALIQRLETHPDEYAHLVAKQRGVLTHLFFDCPMKALKHSLETKLQKGGARPYTWFHKLTDRIYCIKPF